MIIELGASLLVEGYSLPNPGIKMRSARIGLVRVKVT